MWIALQVRPKSEHLVALLLHNKGYECLLPLRSHKALNSPGQLRQIPLFPGYLFCKVDFNCSGPRVVTTPGVIRILGCSGHPSPVPDREIAALRKIADSGLECGSCLCLSAGQQVRIVSGPLVGISGIIVQRNGSQRLVVSIEILRRAVSVAVREEDLVPTDQHSNFGVREQRGSFSSEAISLKPHRDSRNLTGLPG
jgi:transcription antitermination factor NusG